VQLELSPKRVRVIIILITLGCCAFFLAQGSTQLVAATWMPVRASSGSKSAAAPGDDAPPKGELPPDRTAILARNMFDPTTGPLWPPKESDTPGVGATETTATTTPLANGQMPPPCEGQVRLVAAIYSTIMPEWSFASLATGQGSPLLYRIGNQVDGKEVDSVYPEAVFLKQTSGVLCSLTMFKPPGTPTPPPVAKAADPEKKEGDDLDRGIRQQSDTKYQVQRSLVDKLLTNQAELMRSARVVPHEENGRVIGVKLYGIRRSSLLGKLGIQNGDMLRTINGFDMSAPDSALEAYSKLRSASNLSVALVRRGSAVTMDYQIAN
jgi:general secretion pathway protein C